MSKRDIGAALTFVGTLLGAGFGSGRELWQFFARFGAAGILGVAAAMGFFVWMAQAVLVVAKGCGARNHQDFLAALLPAPLRKAADIFLCLYLWISLGVMLSAAAAMARDYLGLPAFIGMITLLLPTLLALAVRQEGLLLCQKVLVPLLVAGILLVAGAALLLPAQPGAAAGATWAWLGNSALYVSYNMLPGLAVLVAMAGDGEQSISPAAGRWGGILLGLTAVLPVVALVRQGAVAARYDLPLLYLAYRQSSALFYLYGALFAAALLTTALSCGYCLCRRFSGPGRPWLVVLAVVCGSALPLGFFSLRVLVRWFYGGAGLLGLVLVPPLAWQWYKLRRQR